jgi:hypothetical protein
MASFIVTLGRFADWRDHAKSKIDTATVEVTEQYARRRLGIRKDEPLVYRGLTLRCIGSKLWREDHAAH